MKHYVQLTSCLVSLWPAKMAGVTEAKRSFWALVNQWKAKKSATLTLKSVNGDLRVSFSVSLGQHDDSELTHQKTRHPLKRGASPSKQRRRQRRAADPAVQLRAEAHGAAQVAAESYAEEADVETLRSEKPDTKSPMVPSPEKEAIREELVDEPGGDGFCEFVEIPHDFGTPDYDHDFEKTKKAEEILSKTDRCCFCGYKCPTPNQLENGGRIFGVLQNLWDHIENDHPKEFEWLG